jgi:MFS family permease
MNEKMETNLEKISQNKDDPKYFTIDEAIDHMGFGYFQLKNIFMLSILYMSEAMELMLLSILGSLLNCSWKRLSDFEQALLTTFVFVGMGLASPVWGKFCDKYGRKSVVILSTFITFYFGALSSVAPTFFWILILRTLVGVGAGKSWTKIKKVDLKESNFFISHLKSKNKIGGASQGPTHLTEFMPSKRRASVFFLLNLLWGIGNCVQMTLSIFVVPAWGWRVYLFICSLPLFVFLILSYWLPESARFYLANGRHDRAMSILETISRENKKELPKGQLSLVKVCYLKLNLRLNLSFFLIGLNLLETRNGNVC